MKSEIRFKAVVAIVAISLPALALAQETGTGAGSSGGGGNGTGTGAGTTTGNIAPTVPAGVMSDPIALFRQLDTDKDGKLSMEEFVRITAIAHGVDSGSPASPRGGATNSGGTGSAGATPSAGSGGTPNAR